MPARFFTSRGLYYGWVVLAVCFVNLFTVMGIRFAFGIFYVAILADTGWQRAETAAIFSFAMAVYACAIIFSGALFDRFGPRRLFPAAMVVMGVGFILVSRIQTVWQFYLAYGGLVGLSFSMLGFPTHMAVVPRWFARRRGLAASVVLAGSGVGSLFFAVLTEAMIVWVGWRTTFWIYGLGIIVLLAPLNAVFQRAHPESVGQHANGAAAAPRTATSSARDGITLWQSMRSPAWWLLLVGVTTIGFMVMTFVVHQTRLSLDFGYSVAMASTLFGFTGVTRAAGGLFWGPLSDRIGRQRCFLLGAALGVVGLLLLQAARIQPHFVFLFGFALIFGVGYMGMTPVYASAVADLFHGRHLGKILATLDIGFGVGSSTGPWLAGYLFDLYGNYDVVLWMMTAATCLTGITLYTATRLRPVRPD